MARMLSGTRIAVTGLLALPFLIPSQAMAQTSTPDNVGFKLGFSCPTGQPLSADADGNAICLPKVNAAALADLATTANYAIEAGHSVTADLATRATNADYSTNAGNATTANSASYSTNAGNATTANSATYSTNAGNATTANSATFATNAASAVAVTGDINGHQIIGSIDRVWDVTANGAFYTPNFIQAPTLVGNAQTATNAGHAEYASNATSAERADYADNAASASYASSAASASYATNSGHAANASNAVSAERADYADSTYYATRAGSASTADNAISRCRIGVEDRIGGMAWSGWSSASSFSGWQNHEGGNAANQQKRYIIQCN